MGKDKTREIDENLEEKIGAFERAKFVAAPVAVTVGSYFTPEIKSKYNGLPDVEREKYKTVALTGLTIFGVLTAVMSGRRLIRDYKEKKEYDSKQLEE